MYILFNKLISCMKCNSVLHLQTVWLANASRYGGHDHQKLRQTEYQSSLPGKHKLEIKRPSRPEGYTCYKYDCGQYGKCKITRYGAVCICQDGFTGKLCDTSKLTVCFISQVFLYFTIR